MLHQGLICLKAEVKETSLTWSVAWDQFMCIAWLMAELKIDDNIFETCLPLAMEFLTNSVLVDTVTVYGLIVQLRCVHLIKLIKLLINLNTGECAF